MRIIGTDNIMFQTLYATKCTSCKKSIMDVVAQSLIHLQQIPKMVNRSQDKNLGLGCITFLLSFDRPIPDTISSSSSLVFVICGFHIVFWTVLTINQRCKLRPRWDQNTNKEWLNKNKLPIFWFPNPLIGITSHKLKVMRTLYKPGVPFTSRKLSALVHHLLRFSKADVKAMHIKVLVSRIVPE